MPEFSHYSVMLQESIDGLLVRKDGVYFDCTAGGGGHSLEIAKRLGEGGRLIAIDRDKDALAATKARLAEYSRYVTLVHSNFSFAQSIAESLNINGVNGAVIDLGVSSYQLNTAERGLSYRYDSFLDMRMDRESPLTAYDVVNTYEEGRLREILFEYGEERYAREIAREIVKCRAEKPVETTGELVEIIRRAMPLKAQATMGHHPAMRSFQAIRIEVNDELAVIEPTLRSLVSLLLPGGRLSVITFHSLEDRQVKKTFAELSSGCTCPPDFPVCVCGKKPLIKLITRKPLLPSKKELEENSRSHSAKLRIIEKL